MGVENDFYWAVHYVPKSGMRRMFEECKKAWGNPYVWPDAVRELVCDVIRYKSTL